MTNILIVFLVVLAVVSMANLIRINRAEKAVGMILTFKAMQENNAGRTHRRYLPTETWD